MICDYGFLVDSVVAGLLASIACGMGALPLLIKRLNIQERVGLGYGFAGGLMFSASVYNFILPGLALGKTTGSVWHVLWMLVGIMAGAGFLWSVDRHLARDRLAMRALSSLGGRREIFIAMSFHSMPEGVAVGVGYASAQHVPEIEHLGATSLWRSPSTTCRRVWRCRSPCALAGPASATASPPPF